ncbi:jg15347 [Pararge aegeria aegeria]|uniref:Jg15347 protein n=1 Tax=Pararge aegeria aegeria TaxID=348720 RepID=A0A8S4RC81_9NEOP|nr:jg15347 [Pararge aegeria aegeria]
MNVRTTVHEHGHPLGGRSSCCYGRAYHHSSRRMQSQKFLPRQKVGNIRAQGLHGGIGLGHPGGGHDPFDEGAVAALQLRAHDGQPLRRQVHATQRARHHAQQPVVADQLLRVTAHSAWLSTYGHFTSR